MSDPLGTRRAFLASTGSSLAAVSFVAPHAVASAPAAPAPDVRLGLIGCGSRGAWIAELFAAHGGYKIAALADYFQDRVDAVGEKLGVSPDHRHIGLECHHKMLAAGEVDAVAIISPPYFHPDQAAAAIDAGRHVYLAKPVAVDVPGSLRVEALGRQATQQRRVLHVDFQTRADPLFTEALRRVRDGAIGEMVFGEASYHADALEPRTQPGTDAQRRLRNWVFDKALSGDIITEQNVHTLDVMSWIMDRPPLAADGTCGRKVRTSIGDASDCFSLVYDYGDGVGVTFSSRQFPAHGTQPSGIVNRMFGTRGVLETKYGGDVLIRGKSFWRGGNTRTIYKDGAVANIAAFHHAIQNHAFDNPTVPPSVRSNLVTILGRTAAYENRRVTWDQMLKSAAVIRADLTGLSA